MKSSPLNIGRQTVNRQHIGLALALVVFVAASFASSAGADGGVVQSASGSGERVLSGAEHGFRTFAFSAIKYSDGSVLGEAEVRNPVLGTLRHFQLDCLNVLPGDPVHAGPIAVLSGVVTSAENPDLIGRHAVFAVQDNGEGGSDPDRTTLGVNLNLATCTDFTDEGSLTKVFPRGLLPIDAGNIQIQT
jgi:hypothetical protein